MSLKQFTIEVPYNYSQTYFEQIINTLTQQTALTLLEITSDGKKAYLKWGDAENIRLRFDYSSSSLWGYIEYKKSSGEWTTNTSGSYYYIRLDLGSSSSSHSGFLEIITSETDILAIGARRSDSTSISSLFLAKIIDRVTGTQVYMHDFTNANTYGSPYYLRYPDDTEAYAIDTTAIPPTGITGTYAIPVMWYLQDTRLTFSGGAGGLELLYYIYDNGTRKTFPNRYTRFSIDGHNFLSLTSEICARLD